MSRENLELIRRSFELFNRDGAEAVRDSGLWSPDFVWDVSPTGFPGFGVYRGYKEVEAFFDDWFEEFPFSKWHVEVEELLEAGDRVVAMTRQRGLGETSGVETELELAQIFTIRDGQIARCEVHLDRQAALEAAGASK